MAEAMKLFPTPVGPVISRLRRSLTQLGETCVGPLDGLLFDHATESILEGQLPAIGGGELLLKRRRHAAQAQRIELFDQGFYEPGVSFVVRWQGVTGSTWRRAGCRARRPVLMVWAQVVVS